jgi:hypothetical protein
LERNGAPSRVVWTGPWTYPVAVTAPRHLRRAGRWWARWAWQPDKWDRLLTVAELAGPHGRVLDVGGRGRELGSLLGADRVTSLNVAEPADVVVPAGPLPFPDGAFGVVTSSDVLEHIPPAARPGHVAELVRVASHRVVLGVPCGSPQKRAAERELAAWLAQHHGARLAFLDEHLAHGLPAPEEVLAWARAAAPDGTVRAWFAGSFPEGDALLRQALNARYRRDPAALLRLGRGWARRRRSTRAATSGPLSDRLFVVVDKPLTG